MSTKRIIKMIIVFLVLLISGCEIRVTVNSPYNKNSLFSDVITEEESSQLLEEYAEKRLPLGTIVVLQGVEYYVMVSGYDILDTDSNGEEKLYQYFGNGYPIGQVEGHNKFTFDTNNITQIVFLGYNEETPNEDQSQADFIIEEYHYLPIGSVIQLKNSEDLYVVLATNVRENETADPVDYFLTIYPEGIKLTSSVIVANNEDISKVVSVGYINSLYFKLIDAYNSPE